MTSPDVSIEWFERAVYLPDADVLVLADIHLGRGETSAIEAPIDDIDAVIERLETLLSVTTAATVVVAGDLLHSFFDVPLRVRRQLDALEEVVTDAGVSLVVTPGNHDVLLESVFDGTTESAYSITDDIVVCHGDERPETTATRYIIGHEHPVLSVSGQKFPCFLYGPGGPNGEDILVLPAFTRLARGATVNGRWRDGFDSPLIATPGPLQPVIRDPDREEPLWFPSLGEVRDQW